MFQKSLIVRYIAFLVKQVELRDIYTCDHYRQAHISYFRCEKIYTPCYASLHFLVFVVVVFLRVGTKNSYFTTRRAAEILLLNFDEPSKEPL